jgi:hypothetical protein
MNYSVKTKVRNKSEAWAIIETKTGRIIRALGADSLAVYQFKSDAYNESPHPACRIVKVKIEIIK